MLEMFIWISIVLLILLIIASLYLKIKKYNLKKISIYKYIFLIFLDLLLIFFVFHLWGTIGRWFITYDNILYDLYEIFSYKGVLFILFITISIVLIENLLQKSTKILKINILFILLFIIIQFFIHFCNRVLIYGVS
jgi:hypothetical protein